jgi:hypothetical protein
MAIRVLQVFATPYATRLLLRDVLYRGDNVPDMLTVTIRDFDDQMINGQYVDATGTITGTVGRRYGPAQGGVNRLPDVVARIDLTPSGGCNSFIASQCGDEGVGIVQLDSCRGLTTTLYGGAIVVLAVLMWAIACCRQRGRTSLRDRRGRRKRSHELAPSDMRCWVPALATLSLLITLLGFMIRSANSLHTLYRLDFVADGFCGINASTHVLDNRAPLIVPETRLEFVNGVNVTVATNRTIQSPHYNNFGCTGGVPEGSFLNSMGRMLGDALVLGALGNVAIIEASGRVGHGRKLAAAAAGCLIIYVVIKFGLWEAWDAQWPESSACPDCPNFEVCVGGTLVQLSDGRHECVGGEHRVGKCLNDIRPDQGNMVGMILPALLVPSMLVLMMLCACGLRDRNRAAKDDASEGDTSDDERRRRHPSRKDRSRSGKGHARDRDRDGDRDLDRDRDRNCNRGCDRVRDRERSRRLADPTTRKPKKWRGDTHAMEVLPHPPDRLKPACPGNVPHTSDHPKPAHPDNVPCPAKKRRVDLHTVQVQPHPPERPKPARPTDVPRLANASIGLEPKPKPPSHPHPSEAELARQGSAPEVMQSAHRLVTNSV